MQLRIRANDNDSMISMGEIDGTRNDNAAWMFPHQHEAILGKWHMWYVLLGECWNSSLVEMTC